MSANHGMKEDLWGLMKMQCEKPDSHGNFFGRLFPEEPNQPSSDQLRKLSLTMKASEDGQDGADSDTPIGFAFFGQFIDHDITLDATTQLGQAAGDVSKIENLRTPRLELDSIYLSGPEASIFLYDDEGRILHGTGANSCDLQRNTAGTAIIGDPRNDENIFISQLHGLFIRLHNYFIDQGKSFEEARKEVRWTYQWAIVNEFLPAILAPALYNEFLASFKDGQLPKRMALAWTHAPEIPISFSAAAYRFGHSHVRQDYTVNNAVSGDLFSPLFRPFSPIDKENNIDWKYFFNIDGKSFLRAKKIDTQLAEALFALPFIEDPEANNLAFRNLERGQNTFHLPYGETVAAYLGIADPIATPNIIIENEFAGTPLWFYILKEAEQSGGKLDKVGGTIVGATLLRMLLNDKESYIHHSPDFIPLKDVDAESVFARIVQAIPSCEEHPAA